MEFGPFLNCPLFLGNHLRHKTMDREKWGMEEKAEEEFKWEDIIMESNTP